MATRARLVRGPAARARRAAPGRTAARGDRRPAEGRRALTGARGRGRAGGREAVSGLGTVTLQLVVPTTSVLLRYDDVRVTRGAHHDLDRRRQETSRRSGQNADFLRSQRDVRPASLRTGRRLRPAPRRCAIRERRPIGMERPSGRRPAERGSSARRSRTLQTVTTSRICARRRASSACPTAASTRPARRRDRSSASTSPSPSRARRRSSGHCPARARAQRRSPRPGRRVRPPT